MLLLLPSLPLAMCMALLLLPMPVKPLKLHVRRLSRPRR